MSMIPRVLTAVTLAAVLFVSPSAYAAEAAMGAESPQALVARMKAAAAKEDLREMAACLAPEPRKELAMGIWMGSTMMIGMAGMMGGMATEMGSGMAESMGADEKEAKAQAEKAQKELEAKLAPLKKKYDAAAKKHGLPTLDQEAPEGDPEAIFAKVDAAAVAADFFAVLKGLGDATGDKSPSPPVPKGELSGVKVTGDNATAQLDGADVTFVRIDGRWYFADMPKRPGGAPGE